ncbi:hypothetical protein J8J40_24135, partial [Mycobacterium tuberculosis]|nr:hypothetical protein [Mycobacterium tuberculosis]
RDAAPFAPETTLGHALLTPTRIYVKPVLAALAEGGVKALALIASGRARVEAERVVVDDGGGGDAVLISPLP